jgi:hypothetical protein
MVEVYLNILVQKNSGTTLNKNILEFALLAIQIQQFCCMCGLKKGSNGPMGILLKKFLWLTCKFFFVNLLKNF